VTHNMGIHHSIVAPSSDALYEYVQHIANEYTTAHVTALDGNDDVKSFRL